MRNYGETRGMDQQKTKTKIKMKDAKKYKAIHDMNCRIGCRRSERIWSMNVVRQSYGETLSLDIEALPVLLMNCQWSREQKSNRVRVRVVSTRHFPKDPNICLKAKLTRASCIRRTGTVVPRAENSGGLITADHRVLCEGCESRHNHRYAFLWCKTWQHSGYNLTRAKQKLTRKQKGAYKSSWSRHGNPKSFALTLP